MESRITPNRRLGDQSVGRFLCCHNAAIRPECLPMKVQPLDFEKPIADLEEQLQKLRDKANGSDLGGDSEVGKIEKKIGALKKEIYGNLTAWQRVQIARHTARPFAWTTSGCALKTSPNCTATASLATMRQCPAGWPKSTDVPSRW